MNDQNDDGQNYALMLLAGVVALVVAGVIALAVSTTLGTTSMGRATLGRTDKAAPAAGKAAATSAMAPVVTPSANAAEPEGRIYFAPGSDALPVEASEVLVKVADAARAQAGRVVLISGVHDASGDAARNAELAKNRALVVRHALEANGVSSDRLAMDKPILTGDADAREVRRVELRLR